MVRVRITLKKGVLDPQGQTITRALHALGYVGVQEVRVGKSIEVQLRGEDEAAVRRQVQEMGGKLLANPVLEDFSFQVEPIVSAAEGDRR
ncbi:MAG TPA: phosphoribosylformylglycinamidine synthase subunit PurS [Firmicutes bacterium]|nr:phosphoribosylformylglycinamidine synthase subunit PurS [Bacillota bacterium]